MSQHHDPVHPDSDHLSAELIADLDEGLLDETSAAHAQHHLLECAPCRDIGAALADVRTALTGLPAPSMPDSVEEQLVAALAAESVAAAPGTTAERVPAPTVVPLDAARSRRSSGWAGHGYGVAASVAVVLLVGAIVVPSLMNSGTSTSDGATSAEGGQGVSATDQTTGERISFAASKSGTKYNKAAFNDQVDKLIATAPARLPDSSTATAVPSNAATSVEGNDYATSDRALSAALRGALATNPAAAQACLEQSLEAVGVQPLAIDIGTFEGQPAAVIVLPKGSKSDKAEVWVIDPTCAGPDAELLYWVNITLNQ